jgi:hypothetical protein
LEDFIFYLWWREADQESNHLATGACPTTMSGRTFAIDFDDWWEPRVSNHRRPLTFAVGAFQRLSLCFPEFLPAKLWRTEFGWRPTDKNPLVWEFKGAHVARYDWLHAPPRFTQSGHPRQPIMGRWIVAKSAWGELTRKHGSFRMLDDFQHFSNDIEC